MGTNPRALIVGRELGFGGERGHGQVLLREGAGGAGQLPGISD